MSSAFTMNLAVAEMLDQQKRREQGVVGRRDGDRGDRGEARGEILEADGPACGRFAVEDQQRGFRRADVVDQMEEVFLRRPRGVEHEVAFGRLTGESRFHERAALRVCQTWARWLLPHPAGP